MGGQGSGSWERWGKKRTLDSGMKIDVRWLKRKGYLQPEKSHFLSWKKNGKRCGLLTFRIFNDHLCIRFGYLSRRNGWTMVEQVIPTTFSPCYYGNTRPWFECPNCAYRCAILYSLNGPFLCRKCYGLPYRSQMQTEFDTLFDQKTALGRRIFEDYEDNFGCQKKKGMHQKTFEKYLHKYDEVERKINKICVQVLGVELY